MGLADFVVPGVSGALDIVGTVMQNDASARQAARQMDFQREMSSTAHQREVADLRAAGLNPILSATGGSGASTPSGAMAPQSNVFKDAFSSAVEVMRTIAETDRLRAEAETTRELGSSYKAKSWLDEMLTSESNARTQGIYTDNQLKLYQRDVQEALWSNPDMRKIIVENSVLQNAILRADASMARREAKKMATYEKWDDTKEGKVLMFLERLIGGYKGRSRN